MTGGVAFLPHAWRVITYSQTWLYVINDSLITFIIMHINALLCGIGHQIQRCNIATLPHSATRKCWQNKLRLILILYSHAKRGESLHVICTQCLILPMVMIMIGINSRTFLGIWKLIASPLRSVGGKWGCLDNDMHTLLLLCASSASCLRSDGDHISPWRYADVMV